jgi:hypothetical protein
LVVVDPLQQAFVNGRTDAIYVVADDFHGVLFFDAGLRDAGLRDPMSRVPKSRVPCP